MVPTVDHMGISWNIMEYHTPKETPETTLAPIMAYLLFGCKKWLNKMQMSPVKCTIDLAASIANFMAKPPVSKETIVFSPPKHGFSWLTTCEGFQIPRSLVTSTKLRPRWRQPRHLGIRRFIGDQQVRKVRWLPNRSGPGEFLGETNGDVEISNLKMGGTPRSSIFFHGIFHDINHPVWFIPQLWKQPFCKIGLCYSTMASDQVYTSSATPKTNQKVLNCHKFYQKYHGTSILHFTWKTPSKL